MYELINTPDGNMNLYVAEPSGTPKGAVIVVQEAFGITSHIEKMCELIADAGWLTVAPAFFHRAAQQVMDYGDMDAVRPAIGALTREGIEMDLDSALTYLAGRGFGPKQVGIVGFCMGGSVTLFAAGTRALGAAVTFYGGGLGAGRFGMPSGLELAARLQTPWLGLYGDLDQGIPVSEVEQLSPIIADAKVPAQVVRYPHADHGFNCNDRPAVFNAEASADARSRMLAWFDAHIASRS